MSDICYNCFQTKPSGVPCPHCGYDQSHAREDYPLALPHGAILDGQYILGRVLGQGGFGITYVAQEYRSRKLVAVKEYLPDGMAIRTGTPTVTAYSGQRGENFQYGKECFLQEAKTLAEFIGNPNIVRVHSYFEENGTAYFVMDYVEGISFQKYIKDHGGKISWQEAGHILVPVMGALGAVHSKGIIHRDVTPDNIFITSSGEVKLLDFGAARYSLGDQSRSLDVVLKHGFAPREQYSRHGRQGPYTDVYSVAASFYYAVTGRRPPDAIDRIDEDYIFTPSSLGINMPAEVEDALLKGMSVHPSDRFQHMEDFLSVLKHAYPPVPQTSVTPKELQAPVTPTVPQASITPAVQQDSVTPEVPQAPVMSEVSQVSVTPTVQQDPIAPEIPKHPTSPAKEKKKWIIPAAVGSAAMLAVIFLIVVIGRINSGSQPVSKDQTDTDSHSKNVADTSVTPFPWDMFESADDGPEMIFGNTITADTYQTLGLKSDGTVFAVGLNFYGECDVSDWKDIVSISTGGDHTVGLRADGTVAAVGYNGDGQCEVSDWTDIVAVSAGRSHTVGVKSDGTVVAVGNNDDGQCEVSDWTDVVSISAASRRTVGLKSDGTVVAVGWNIYGQCDVSDWTDIVFISASASRTVGLRSDGTVVAVGNNDCGQCDVSGWTDVVSVSAGAFHTIGLRSDGTLLAVGANDYGQCDISGWTDIVAVCAGSNHTIGLRADGTVLAVGYNGEGECEVSDWTDIAVRGRVVSFITSAANDSAEPPIENFTPEDNEPDEPGMLFVSTISAGGRHTVGLKSDGTVVAVGSREYGCEVEDWTGIVSVSAGWEHTVGLRSDGTAVAVGDTNYGECEVSDWTDIVSVSAGVDFSVGLKSDGTVVAVGDNGSGQCEVNGWSDIVSVSAGFNHTVGLKSDGTVVAVGNNENGECEVSEWRDIVSVSAGSFFTVGLKSDGTVVAVGNNNHGQCWVSGWSDIVSVSAGGWHTVGLKSDGTVVAVGSNNDGQCEVGDWSDIVSVSASSLHTAGLRSDGTAIAVGFNMNGRCEVSGWNDIMTVPPP